MGRSHLNQKHIKMPIVCTEGVQNIQHLNRYIHGKTALSCLGGGDAENAEHKNLASNSRGGKTTHENRGKGTMERQHNLHSKKYCNCKMHCNVDEKRH